MQINGFKDIHFKHIIMDFNSIQNIDNGRLEGLNLTFKPINEDKIYHKTNGSPVGFFPNDLNITLDIKGLITLNSLLLETVSSYLYNLRQKVFTKDLNEIIYSKLDDKRYIKVRVSKYFFREEEKGRYKISIAVIKKGDKDIDDSEIVNINFTKRDVIIFMSILKRITTSYFRENATSVFGEIVSVESNEILKESNFLIAKIDSSILIDKVWLHGQELMNIMFVLQELIFNLNIEERLEALQSFYRQVKFVKEEDILYLELSKMNINHQYEYLQENGEDAKIRIPITGYLLSTLYLYLDINILKHADFESELLDNVEILGSTKTDLGKGVKYHLGMKESILGISIKERKKNPDESKISLVGQVKQGHFSEVNEFGDYVENFMKMYDKNNNQITVPVMTEFDIDLRNQWHKLVRALSVAYTRNYKEEKDFNLVKFFVINQTVKGRFKYEFTIHSDKNNKAPAVLIIDRYNLKNKDEVFEARYRQPLFKKYIYQLMLIILASAQEIEKIELLEEIETKDLLKYHYKSFKSVKEVKKSKTASFGLKKVEDQTLLGNFAQPNLYVTLNTQDIEILNISSEFRIFNSSWIPFVGDNVAIGQDGYLTDMFGEVNLEENDNGADWAVKLFFGTSI